MPSRILHTILIGIAALALIVPALVVRYGPRVVPHRVAVSTLPTRRVVPPAELPPVEPVALAALSPEDARAYNSDVPFTDAPNPVARPFRLAEATDDVARATDCLAAAVSYEAGDDPPGERAVAQVVLNRVRHPAFPKTVCGVVFQGAERHTGCQFTFTCDGSIDRRQPSATMWVRARTIAAAALRGAVYRPVGWATHYHTDYVVPYWEASLDKLVAVHTQLFYRWSGWWGTPRAFDRRAQPGEPVIAALAPLSEAHRPAADIVMAVAAGASPLAAIETPVIAVPVEAIGADSFLVTLPPGLDPALYPLLANKACGDRLTCKYDGWTDAKKTPAHFPVEANDLATMTFGYLRDRPAGLERTLWNCAQVKRPNPAQCLKMQAFQPVSAMLPPPRIDPDLGGLRRKSELKPTLGKASEPLLAP